MNVVELLGRVKACFENVNPDVVVPQKFSDKKMQILNTAVEAVKHDQNASTTFNLVKIWTRMMSGKDNKAYVKCMRALQKDKSLPLMLQRKLQSIDGEGQLRFSVESPAGPSRLCRVPFYPIRDENAWSTRYLNIDSNAPSRQPFGIETLGDDPVVAIGPWLGNQNTTKISGIQLETQKVEFGAYRLIGMEINADFGSRYIGAIEDGVGSTGSIEVLGVPSPATGQVSLIGPAAAPAEGVLEVIGTGATATGSVEFTTVEKYATGSIEIDGDGTAGWIETRLVGGGTIASADIQIAGASQVGANLLIPSNGDAASGFVQIPNASNLGPGDQLQLTNTGPGTGVGSVVELYEAVIGAPATPLEFTVGATSAATMQNLATAIDNNPTSVFSATYSTVPGQRRVTITQNNPGTHGNQARGASIATVGFPALASTQQFSGGTDSITVGNTIEITDRTGAVTTYTAILSGSVPAAFEFETFGSGPTTLVQIDAAMTANPYNFMLKFLGGGTLLLGFQAAGAGYVPLQFVAGTGAAEYIVFTTADDPALTRGFDALDFESEIEISVTSPAPLTLTFAPQPLGTVVPPLATRFPFQTFPDAANTGASLETAINGSPLSAFVTATHLGGGLVRITAANRGRYANDFTLAYQTIGGIPFDNDVGPRGLGAVPEIFTTFDTSFTGGTSPISAGLRLTLQDFAGNSYVFTATDGVTDANNFGSEFDLAATANNFLAMLVAFGQFPSLIVDNQDPDWITFRIQFDEPGTYTGTRQASVNVVGEITLSNDAVNFVPSLEDYAQGTNSVNAGQEVTITDTLGVSTTIEFVDSSPTGNQVLSQGLADDTASNLATFINGLSGFTAASVGPLVEITQVLAGSQGNTVIVENPVTADLTSVNFSGGDESYQLGQTIEFIDTDGTSFVYTSATANSGGAGTDFRAYSQAEAASNLADRINAQAFPLTITAVAVGNTVNVTQVTPGLSGNTVITPSNPFVVNVVNFSGGADLVTPGTTITVADTVPAIGLFTGVSGVPAANEFDTRGSADDIALSIANQVGGSFLTVSASSLGPVVTILQDEVGTIGNGSALSSSNVAEIAETTAPFANGIDNVSVAPNAVPTTFTVEDSFGQVRTFTAVRGAPGANEFIVDQLDPNVTANNMALAVAAAVPAFDVTAIAVGNAIELTQGTNGPDGNTPLLTNNGGEMLVSGMTGGTFSIEIGSTIELTDTTGTTVVFEAVSAPPVGNQYQVVPLVSDTLDNLNNAIIASGIQITGVQASPFLNLEQDIGGAAGDTPIVIAGDPGGTLAAVSFAGGVDPSLNLNNDLSPVAITVRELTVYNGNNILIVEDSESASVSDFNILNKSDGLSFKYVLNGAEIDPSGQTAYPMTIDARDSGYKFIGFRDQPIVDPNSQVHIKIDAFIKELPVWNTNGGATPYPANTPLPKIAPVSVSVNLVVDLLEDKVFGDMYAPSPASRAAANVKLSSQRFNGKIVINNGTTKKPRI